MASEPPPKLRRAPTGTEPPATVSAPVTDIHVLAYQLALKLAGHLDVVMEMSDDTDAFLHDTLDKRSIAIPQIVARAVETTEMVVRRGLFENARLYATECEAILDALAQRGTVGLDALEPAVASCRELRAHLAPLTRRS